MYWGGRMGCSYCSRNFKFFGVRRGPPGKCIEATQRSRSQQAKAPEEVSRSSQFVVVRV